MALFIAQLAFRTRSSWAKLSVLAASGGAAIIGLALGRALLPEIASGHIAQTADEAESSTEL
jgi:Na+/H+ antiporter NhaA